MRDDLKEFTLKFEMSSNIDIKNRKNRTELVSKIRKVEIESKHRHVRFKEKLIL